MSEIQGEDESQYVLPEGAVAEVTTTMEVTTLMPVSTTLTSDTATPETTTSTTTTTTTSTTTTTVKPILNAKVFVCTANPTADVSLPSIPDGLCDFLMYRPTTVPFTSEPGDELKKFTELIPEFGKTHLGIDIRQEIRDAAISQLKEPSGKTALASLYKQGVQDYSTFDVDIYVDTTEDAVKDVIGFLQTIKAIQTEAKGDSAGFGYLFVGVSPLAHNISDDTATTKMWVHFQRIIDEVMPDGVLFLTTYLRTHYKENRCRSTGPSLWTRAIMFDQPTFEDSLNFRKGLKIPANVTQLLSLSVHGRWSSYTEAQMPKTTTEKRKYLELGDSRVCNETGIYDVVSYTCVNSTHDRYKAYRGDGSQDNLDYLRLTRVVRSSYPMWVGGYDSWGTMSMKMCKAYTEYGHRGGWVVFDLQLADVLDFCTTGYTQGFGHCYRIKNYMYEEPTVCVMNATVDAVERGIKL
ncbi:uncharacterized protein LOC135389949 [Ornithodoros turicata]|uniref:uncharacterized protein LOC135389949 n=1 Tax=Ornithodoros turicata TaxID=34597 RepID=UPI003139C7E8